MNRIETTKHIIRFDCDGAPDKPELPPGYDARDTVEYEACMAEDAAELLVVFDQIVKLAKQRGDIQSDRRPTPEIDTED